MSVATPLRLGPNGPIQKVDCSGEQVVRAPEWTGAVGLSQEFDAGSFGSFTLSGNMTFASARDLTFDFVEATRTGGYATFNASLAYNDPGDRFTVMAFVRNAGNEAVYSSGEQPTFAPNTALASVGLPRTYGVRIDARF